MAMSATLKVDTAIANSMLDSFRGKLNTLKNVMARVREIMTALATVSWISPGSAALLQKFLTFYKQLEEALKIVEEYIHDLEIVIEAYTKIEDRLTESAGSLRTDVFGV